MRIRRRAATRGLGVLLLLIGVAAIAPSPSPGSAQSQLWRSGDVVLLNGTSIRSSVVRFVQGYSADYSHVGIVAMEGETAFVIHADPAVNAVVKERWSEMAASGQYAGGAIYRLPQPDPARTATILATAEEFARAKIPFDHDFDLAHSDRLYCTELVWLAYLQAGVELRNAAGKEARVLLPSHLVDGAQLQLIARF